MSGYFAQKAEQYRELVIQQKLFEKFCTSVFGSEEISLEPSELSYFQDLRKEEEKDFKWRRFTFWPLWVCGMLLFDNIVVIPATRTNFVRGTWNLFLGIPFVSIVTTGVVFYREKFESHEYAFGLCEKYGIYLSEEEKNIDFVDYSRLYSEKLS